MSEVFTPHENCTVTSGDCFAAGRCLGKCGATPNDGESLTACRKAFEAGFKVRLRRKGDVYENPYVQMAWEDAQSIWEAAIEFARRESGKE